MAEVVRRRYTRLLNESNAQSPNSEVEGPKSGNEGGEAIPLELQKLIAETSAKVKRGERIQRDPPHSAVALPDLILIDGGKGQLNAATAELEKLGLGRIPVIGLAKEFEEIHRPGGASRFGLGWITRR